MSTEGADPGRRPGAYGIVRRDGRVLLVWDQSDAAWYFPGGGIEAGETPAEALAREVREETGFRLVASSPLVYGEQLNPRGVTKEQHFFLAEVDETDPGPAEHEAEWVVLHEAAERLEPASRTALALATPSIVTTVVDDLHDPVLPDPGTEHLQAVADAGCFAVVEVGGNQPPPTEPANRLRIAAANLERGRRLEDWLELFGRLDADVLLLSELDGGMARSGNRYVARELAERLDMGFAFAVEFLELGLGGREERAALPPGAGNEFGVHGGAILSRLGLDRPAAVRLELDGAHWYGPDSPEPRVGGRLAVVATVGDVVVVAPHLESHGGPRGRARQVADLLDLVEGYAEGRPVVIGGDLNTHTLDLSGEEATDGQEATTSGVFDDERFVRPFAHEPLFAEAAARGYGWEDANTDEPTHRTVDRGGPVRGKLNLDWFLTRDVAVSDPEVVPVLAADGSALSDHDVIVVSVTSLRSAPPAPPMRPAR